MRWVLHIVPKARKRLAKLDSKHQATVFKALEELEHDPKLGITKKLSGLKSHRKADGRIRIIFKVEDNLIIVLWIGLRDENTYK